MPTKVSVGLSRKTGLPNYSSIGASCHVELELDASVLDSNPERFRLQVQRAYAACRDSVETELRQRPMLNGANESNGNPSAQLHPVFRHKQRTATPGQLRTIEGIGARRRINLQPLLEQRGVSEAKELSVMDASDLISELQADTPGPDS